MATGNFTTQKDFKLLAHTLEYTDPDTGETLYDEWEADNITYALDKINDDLTFYNLTLTGGYYSGAQIEVNPNRALDNCDPLTYTDTTNEDTHYWHGYCKSTTKRKIQAEINKINNRIFKQLQQEYGFKELQVTARFSNGETIYSEVK